MTQPTDNGILVVMAAVGWWMSRRVMDMHGVSWVELGFLGQHVPWVKPTH
jgi:hypothetical protein